MRKKIKSLLISTFITLLIIGLLFGISSIKWFLLAGLILFFVLILKNKYGKRNI